MQVFLRARRLTAALCVTGVTVLVSVFSASGASAQSALEVNYDFGAAALANFNAPMVPPPGSNNWSCKRTAAHPYPLVLVHGTLANMNDNWQAASPILANHGYCVFAFYYNGAAAT